MSPTLKSPAPSFTIRNTPFGRGFFQMMAGPCSVENAEQIFAIAACLAELNVPVLRGGAFKPRSSPYSFQGLGLKGLQLLKAAADEHNLLTVSEIMDAEDLSMMEEHVDILQVGSRNMQNYSLLKKLGKSSKPVLLKRGCSATYQELLLSAEYILSGGNQRVILCERGVRTFESYTRNMLDLSAVPILKELSNLPVIVDPSHGTGRRELIEPLSKAAVAAGADGLMIEIHPNPDEALSDKEQTISCQSFKKIVASVARLKSAL